MPKPGRFGTIALLLCAGVLSTSSMADDKYKAATDGKVTIACTCVAGGTACQSKLFDSLSGSERFQWNQTGYTKKGAVYNLDEACYRKRDVKGAGDSLCCEVPGDEQLTIKNLFRGSVK
jgi:hypothetical protein